MLHISTQKERKSTFIMAPRTSNEHLSAELRQILDQLPREPGVYLLKDHQQQVIYVGKAKSLFARVRSYFTRSGDTRAFVPLLEQLVGDVETMVTRNEKEALLLENTLIKRHKPRFNVMLRDDKNYLVLRLDPRTRFPRLEVIRRIKDDGARHFGPYHSATSCRQTLRLINRHFQLRTCRDRTLESRKRPCLQHQIGRCLAPCVFDIDEQLYARQVEDVTLFLRGKSEHLLQSLEQRMRQAADDLEFELAARIRDQMAALRSALERQQVVTEEMIDHDIFGYFREGEAVDLVVLLMREGKLVARRAFSLSGQAFPDEEVLSGVVSRYYDRGEQVPAQVLVPLPLDDAEAKRRWLTDLRGSAVQLRVPRRGPRRRLLDLAQRNARSNFETRRRRDADLEEALAKLQRRLRLGRLPRRIECYDISQLHGQGVVASMVVMTDGVPRPPRYRRFRIQAQTDDFAAIYEVLSRRLRRAREGSAGWELPDLLVVDGGKAQLSMALAALRDVGLPRGALEPDVVALAKERTGGTGGRSKKTKKTPRQSPHLSSGPKADDETSTDVQPSPDDQPSSDNEATPDRVFLPHVKDPILLRPNTSELFLLSRIRDEAHRFAITYHKSLRRRQNLRSGLEDIPGIGPKRRRALLRKLGSLKRVRAASVEQLQAVPGMSSRAAEAVAEYFVERRPQHASEAARPEPAGTPQPGADAGEEPR